MDQKKQKEILILATKAGKIMMKSGAEIYRVEDTIERICLACGVDHVNVFAMPTGIFVSINNEDQDDTVTYIRRIKGGETDLTKIAKVNSFSREFTTTDMTIQEGLDILNDIENGWKYPFWIRVIGAALVASAFGIIFGGSALDGAVAAIVGALSYTLSRFLEKYDINFFIRGFVCTAFATACALIASASLADVTYSYTITGCIMLFVPGVAITNSIRDFLSGDMVSGLARMTEAALIGISLAAGAGVVIKMWSIFGGVVL